MDAHPFEHVTRHGDQRDLVDLGARLVVDVDAHRGVGPARPSRSPIVMAGLAVTIGG
jgi:hypothetical protein